MIEVYKEKGVQGLENERSDRKRKKGGVREKETHRQKERERETERERELIMPTYMNQ